MVTDALAAVKAAAMEAATAADIATRYLLVAGARTTTDPTIVIEYLERAFHAHQIHLRAMERLEQLAPNSAAAGRDDDSAIRELVMNAIAARSEGNRQPTERSAA